MNGKYRGEHAAIRKAMNATAESLHESISQVSETVGLVSDVGKKITSISSVVTQGAEEQSVQLNEASMSLVSLSGSASHSAKRTAEANGNAKLATESILMAKESMNRMVASMSDISGAAENTTSIANEIDGIANLAASEALEYLLRGRYCERRCFFIVEGTQTKIVNASFLQGYKFLHYIHDIRGIEDPVYGLAVDHDVKISGIRGKLYCFGCFVVIDRFASPLRGSQ